MFIYEFFLLEKMAVLEHIIQQETVSISSAIALVRGMDYHTLSHITNTSSSSSSELETEISSVDLSPTISYTLAPELLAQNVTLDYVQLWYGNQKTTPPSFTLDDEYWTSTIACDVKSEMISDEEAQRTIVDIQYATIMGSSMEINFEERRKLNLWILFNPALFKLTESLYSVTGNVDYRPMS